MMQLTRTHRILIGLVVAGAVLIAAIGFAGSYAAVRELALSKGFGDFSLVFPIGIDAGICVLLALDLLLTWLRIPFPLLRQTAWLLTAATIAFNGAAAWPDPLGVGMHAVIPVLFVVSVEAARHAVGRIADITADKHMEGVRLTRWLLSPVPTFRLWRRMKLWELRSYEQVIKLEQDRLIYQARLQARYGRAWRRRAPVESLMPLRLAKYGVPLAETGPAGLAAAGIEPALLPPAPALPGVADEGVVNDSDRVPVTAAAAVDVAVGGRPVGSSGAGPSQIEASAPVVTGRQFVDAGEQEEQQSVVALPDIDYRDAVQGYLAQFGRFPDAVQLGSFLAQYGVVGATGDPLPEALLGPVLDGIRNHMQSALEHEDVEARSAAPSGSEHHDDGRDRPAAVAGHASAAVEPPGEPEPEEFGEGALFEEDGPWTHTGTAADRTGAAPRITAQVRIPAPAGSPEQTREVLPEPEPGQSAEEEEPGSSVPLLGPALVEYHYRELSPEEQQRSANALAPVLAEQTGYAVGTVRKYIGQIKRSDAAAMPS